MLEKKVHLLEEVFGSYFTQGKELLFYCPFCRSHKKKLSINIDKNAWKCWVCGKSGTNLAYAISKIGTQSQLSKWKEMSGVVDFSSMDDEQETEEQVKLPDEFISLTSKSPTTIKAKKYLLKRGLQFDDILKWKMGFCSSGKYENRVIIPSFCMSGDVDYFVARTIGDYGLPYLNPPSSKDIIFNELYLDWNKDITIVEGVFDAIVSGNSIPLLGSLLREDSNIFQSIVSKCQKVYLALDPDAKAKEHRIMSMFLSYGIEVLKVPIRPWKDVGEMSKEEFQQRKQSAIPVDNGNDLDYVIRSFNE